MQRMLMTAFAILSLSSLARAGATLIDVKVVGYSGNAWDTRFPQTGGCPDGTLNHSVRHFSDGFSIIFEPKPGFFTLDSSDTYAAHGTCDADIKITIPSFLCYALNDIEIEGEADLNENQELAFYLSPQTRNWDAANRKWIVEETFNPRTREADIRGPHSGPFWSAARPRNLLKNDARLAKCSDVSYVNLNMETRLLDLASNLPLSHAHITRYTYHFSTMKRLFMPTEFDPDRFRIRGQ